MTTNFRKIKQMNIDELTDFIIKIQNNCNNSCVVNGIDCDSCDCEEKTKQWLESESEG